MREKVIDNEDNALDEFIEDMAKLASSKIIEKSMSKKKGLDKRKKKNRIKNKLAKRARKINRR